ncbi:MAG TPA: hypothetical protein VM580_14395 [Labilithrix sp.]|nr:hypothetical protein [Labilithrix sp.]
MERSAEHQRDWTSAPAVFLNPKLAPQRPRPLRELLQATIGASEYSW